MASTVIVVPVEAASIISPMIDVPPTVSPPRVTLIIGVEALGGLHELRRGAGVQALLVDDLEHANDRVVGRSSVISRRGPGSRW